MSMEKIPIMCFELFKLQIWQALTIVLLITIIGYNKFPMSPCGKLVKMMSNRLYLEIVSCAYHDKKTSIVLLTLQLS